MLVQDNKPLSTLINAGIKLYPLYPDGTPKVKYRTEEKERYIKNITELKQFWKNGVKRFGFVPGDSGLIGFDIDIKHENGENDIYKIFDKHKLNVPLSFSKPLVYILSPSGGRHIFFRYTGKSIFESYLDIKESKNVEIKHSAKLITAAGSRTEAGIYKLFGSWQDIEPLPLSVEKLLIKPDKMKRQSVSQNTCNNKTSDKRQLALDKIQDILSKQGHTAAGGRNNYCFEFSKFALKQGHREYEIINYLSYLIDKTFPLREIENCIRSANR